MRRDEGKYRGNAMHSKKSEDNYSALTIIMAADASDPSSVIHQATN